jgi:hypothetical protein
MTRLRTAAAIVGLAARNVGAEETRGLGRPTPRQAAAVMDAIVELTELAQFPVDGCPRPAPPA